MLSSRWNSWGTTSSCSITPRTSVWAWFTDATTATTACSNPSFPENMPARRPALVVFQGGASLSPTRLEQVVDDAQQAATLDLLQRAAASRAFEQAFLV